MTGSGEEASSCVHSRVALCPLLVLEELLSPLKTNPEHIQLSELMDFCPWSAVHLVFPNKETSCFPVSSSIFFFFF